MTNSKIGTADPTTHPEQYEQESVRELQTYLRQLSFYNHKMPQLVIDGIYGPETAHAVQIFQESVGLNPTGFVDLVTWNAIVDEYNRVMTQIKEPNMIAPFPSADYVLKPGGQCDLVYILQIMLNCIGKYFINVENLPITGIYDTKTCNVVKKIQKIMDLEPHGNVNKITWDNLANAYNAYR